MNHEAINQTIDKILEQRKVYKVRVAQALDGWNAVQSIISDAADQLSAISSHDLGISAEVDALLASCAQAKNDAIRAKETLNTASVRFARDTVNIGVSGAARMGKSTLLQSISGLEDEQIPTGSGVPVTAVRSRIYHTDDEPHAKLVLHTYDSFRKNRLEPLYEALGLGSAPATLEQFRHTQLPKTSETLNESVRKHQSADTMLLRLWQIYDALESYEALLTGGEQRIDLQDLRPYVAYPTQDEEHRQGVQRKYLAVQDCAIYAKFPQVQVSRVGIVDLPGLGEVVPQAEQPMVEGLRNEADLVLFVKRPLPSTAFWQDSDAKAMDILDDAREPISQRRDYVFLVLNTSDPNDDQTRALRTDIQRKVNLGDLNSRIQVLEGNATDNESVAQNILMPALEHLANRLSIMDEEVWQAVETHTTDVYENLQVIENGLMRLTAALAGENQHHELVSKLSRTLKQQLLTDFHNYLTQLDEEKIVSEFNDRVDTVQREAVEWINNVFGYGSTENWVEHFHAQAIERHGVEGVSELAINEVRVEISQRFLQLEFLLDQHIDLLRQEIGQILRTRTGKLLLGVDKSDLLNAFLEKCDETEQGCPTFRSAIENLLSIQIQYNAHLHPWVREGLQELYPRQITKNDDSRQQPRTTSSDTEENYITLLTSRCKQIQNSAISTIENISKKMKARERRTIHRILRASLGHFDDVMIRSRNSDLDFTQLSQAYYFELWPGHFEKEKERKEAAYRLSPIVEALARVLNQNSIRRAAA